MLMSDTDNGQVIFSLYCSVLHSTLFTVHLNLYECSKTAQTTGLSFSPSYFLYTFSRGHVHHQLYLSSYTIVITSSKHACSRIFASFTQFNPICTLNFFVYCWCALICVSWILLLLYMQNPKYPVYFSPPQSHPLTKRQVPDLINHD